MAQPYHAPAPVEARIPNSPIMIEGTDHHLHLAYELHLTNFDESTGPLTIRSLSVFENSSTLPVTAFSKEQLMKLLNSDEMPKTGTDIVIPPGKRKVLFLWLTLPPGTAPPKKLRHTIEFLKTSGLDLAQKCLQYETRSCETFGMVLRTKRLCRPCLSPQRSQQGGLMEISLYWRSHQVCSRITHIYRMEVFKFIKGSS
ncbi:MAG TPA: hypothetical protein VK638_06540 [Edaphobacter sp.]|nr:hypothetical protein [Edaphobacter sp.]